MSKWLFLLRRRTVLKSQRGSSLLLALLVVLAVGMTYTFVLGLNQSSEKQIYRTRFRNQLNLFETRWRQLLAQPSSYTGCDSKTTTSCQINPAVFQSNQVVTLTGAGCDENKMKSEANREQGTSQAGASVPTTLKCGFAASVVLDQANHKASLTITPVGTLMKPVIATISIPADILQTTQASCPAMYGDAKPMFLGLNADGTARCAPLTKPSCDPDSEYASGINSKTGAIQCLKFPNYRIGCGRLNYLTSYTWDVNGSQVKHGCAPRKRSYETFGY